MNDEPAPATLTEEAYIAANNIGRVSSAFMVLADISEHYPEVKNAMRCLRSLQCRLMQSIEVSVED